MPEVHDSFFPTEAQRTGTSAVAHASPPWIVALHRFVEVSLGIAVALLVTVLWRTPAR